MTTGLVPIGKCVSGVLYQPADAPQRKYGIFNYPRVVQHLALATQHAFRDLSRNHKLLRSLDRSLAKGKLESTPLVLAGFVPTIYEGRAGWTTFGIRYFNPPSVEAVDYKEAESRVYSLTRGATRKVHFGILGVRAEGIENLPEVLFSKLLGRIAVHYDDPSFDGISFIRVAKTPFDQIETGTDGSQGLVLSMKMLEEETARSRPTYEVMNHPIPINPDGSIKK